MNKNLRKRMIDSVSEDSDLTPMEKETSIHFAKDEDRLTVFSAEAGIMRRLLAHPEFEIDEIRQTTGDGKIHVGGDELEAEFDGRRQTIAVKGSAPVGLLFLKGKSRKSTGHADVVSNTASDISLGSQ